MLTQDKKLFVVDYFYQNDKNDIKTHMLFASSRKQAEWNTREMESQSRINIIKIYPILFNDDMENSISEAIHNHISKNINFVNSDTDMEDEYNAE